ncbi:MAG: gliding motility-associated ABC transporter permease subunit GldF [Bacteroidia bacterium]
MIAILRKEINLFFSSLIAYIVIAVFLVMNSLFIWILPDSSVLEFGYATLDQLFEVAPWVFMFLVPAITMRFFAEERRSGTIEIIATKPVSNLRIVLGKYFAGLVLVIFSILPTLLYFYTIYVLAAPVGNVDIGATTGSYIGLLLLGGCYVGLGLLASSITDNQIVAFIAGLFLCFLFYALLEWLRSFTVMSPLDPVLEAINIQSHYTSISRGVLDTRDLVYFLSLIGLSIGITNTIIESRKW